MIRNRGFPTAAGPELVRRLLNEEGGHFLYRGRLLAATTRLATTSLGCRRPSPLPRFVNNGVFIYNGTIGTDHDFFFENNGLVDVQDSGIRLDEGGNNSGLVIVRTGTIFEIRTSSFTNDTTGTIGGNGTFQLTRIGTGYTNDGTFAPGLSVGTLDFDGDYANSTLEVELDDGSGPGSGHDLLNVSGNAPLSDTASVILDAGFNPAVGDQFTIMNCGGTCSGNFDVIEVDSPDHDFIDVVTADSVILQVTQTLPVELAGLAAALEGLDVVLTWQTQTETDNAGFEIQRRAVNGEKGAESANDWIADAWIEGAGTTLEAQEYSYRFEEVDPGSYNFRLKQVDFDGAFTYSPQVEVTVEVPGTHLLVPAYPNPFNPHSTIRLAVAREQDVRIDVFDIHGRLLDVLFDGTIPANQTERLTIDGSRWSSGIYHYRVVGETFTDIGRAVLVK